jgi:hypothetical protein
MSYSKFLDSEGSEEEIRDRWIIEKRYSELSAYIHDNWDLGQWDVFFEPFEKHLLENNLEKEYVKFWKGILRNRLEILWDWNKEFGKKTEDWDGTKKTLKAQQFTLEGLDRFKKGLTFLNSQKELRKLELLEKSVIELKKPKIKKTADNRKIDETLFWVLIESNRIKSNDKIDFIENISNDLENFKSSEIKRFERIFLTKYEELNRWDIWALAYIVRGGCGDDAFDYFKAWVISKGKNTFQAIKQLKIQELKHHFDEDPQFEEILSLSESVYESKTGELMPLVKVKRQKLIGAEWDENNIELEFPELCKLFEWKS